MDGYLSSKQIVAGSNPVTLTTGFIVQWIGRLVVSHKIGVRFSVEP